MVTNNDLRFPIFNLHFILFFLLLGCNSSNGQKNAGDTVKTAPKKDSVPVASIPKPLPPPPPPVLDTALYNKAVLHMVNDSPKYGWPVKTSYPLPGAILPFKRIVAYYGNFYSTRMGILGELPPDEMVKKLQGEVKKWKKPTRLPRPYLPYITLP